MNIPTTAQVAASLERTARIAAPVVALIITSVILLAELSYALGYQLGSAVHARNDQLSALWRRLWAAEPQLSAEQPKQSIQAPVALPATHPLMALADDLQALSCNQLRAVLRTKSKAAKRLIVQQHLALAI